jgi:Protein of unknown function (DUF1292).
MDKIIFTDEDGNKLELYALETTRLGGVDYLLASDVETGDGECYILKDLSEANSPEAVYQMVEDEHELDYLLNIFSELVEDVDFEF